MDYKLSHWKTVKYSQSWKVSIILDIKNIGKCVEIIKFYESLRGDEAHFSDSQGNHTAMVFNLEKKKFSLKLVKPKTSIISEIFEIRKNEPIKITRSLLSRTNQFDSSEFTISEFESVLENEISDRRFRLIMKFTGEIRLDHYFERVMSVYTDISKQHLNAFQANIDTKELLVYFAADYFIIESNDISEKEHFLNTCRLILTGLSYIVGKAPGDYAYIFEYESNYDSNHNRFWFDSSFPKQVDSSNYSPINSNCYSYCREIGDSEEKKLLESLRSEFKGISRTSFSNLCDSLRSNDYFADGVYAIIEARQSSLMGMGVLYSVSLEALSTAISSNNAETTHCIQSKADRKKLRNQLLETARNFFLEKKLSFDDSAIKKRIENINSPTNRDKLLSPFAILSIPLFDDDKEIIGKRNDFLHGNTLINRNGVFEEEALGLLDIALRMSFLVNSLVLKHIGHSGYIYNHAGCYIKTNYATQKCYRLI